MRYLIDTHILLWLLFSPNHLSKSARPVIEDQNNKLLVSQISLWEISLKYSLGKLKLIRYKPEDLLIALEKINISILELDNKHILNYDHLRQTKHKDPFDRILIWQAISLDIPIISKDKTFDIYKADGLKLVC